MRTSPTAYGLLIVAVLAVVAVSRLSRSLGPAGPIITIALIIVVAALARELLVRNARRGGVNRRKAPTKDVTPREPALPMGVASSTRGSTSASHPPTIVVIDPHDGTERLAAKLEALDELRAGGVVSEAEYEAKRATLIADF